MAKTPDEREPDAYVPPALRPLGSVAELTRFDDDSNSVTKTSPP